MKSASDLCGTVFALLEQRRWDAIPDYIEAKSLAGFRRYGVDHLRAGAGTGDGTTESDIDELDAAEVLVRVLEMRHPPRPSDSGEPVSYHGTVRRVVGEVRDGDVLAHVLYTHAPRIPRAPASVVAVASAVLTPEGWKLLATGEWCGMSDWMFVMAGVVPFGPLAPLAPDGPRQRPWTERRFENGRGADLFPAILERSRGTPARAMNLVVRVPREACTFQPGGAWSVQQHIGHIIELDGLSDRRLDEFLAGAETLTAADMSNRATEQADYNARDLWDVVEKLYEARDALVHRLEGLDAGSLNRRSHHPRLDQTMTVTDWLHFMCEHDDHHLASINRILREWRPGDVHS